VRNAGSVGNVTFGTGIVANGSLLPGQAAFVTAESVNGTVDVFADVLDVNLFQPGTVTALGNYMTISSGTLDAMFLPGTSVTAIGTHMTINTGTLDAMFLPGTAVTGLGTNVS